MRLLHVAVVCVAIGASAALSHAQQVQPTSSGNPTVAPQKWMGRLVTPAPTAQHPNQVSECTAQFIAPNVLLTAGHCLRDLPDNPTGPWYDLTNQIFQLQYQAGVASQTFKTVCGAVNPQWTLPANFSSMSVPQKNDAIAVASQHDFAMILVNGNSPTGAMPYMLDWKGKVNSVVRVGYAGDILDEEIIQRSPGIVFFANDIPLFDQSTPNLVVQWQSLTDFTNGSSGGAWVANYNSTEGANNNKLIAVTSFGNSSYPGGTFAAYLTAAEFNPLLANVQGGCKGGSGPPAPVAAAPSGGSAPAGAKPASTGGGGAPAGAGPITGNQSK